MENQTSAPSSRRSYVTPRRDQRAAATRTRILSAAEELFLRDGYTRTSMKAVATLAGVSEKTMYLTFSTKANLLRHVIQVAVQGDESSIPLSQRPQWRAVVAGATDGIFGRFAALNAATMSRTAAIIALGEAAASTDPELAEYRDRAHTVTRADLRALAAELNRRGALGPAISEDDTVDTLYAVATNESVFLRLTQECGWTPQRYAELIARTLTATLGASEAP